MKHQLTCIVCPIGCQVVVDDKNGEVAGYSCERGIAYAKKELTNPTRTITSTVKIVDGLYERLPVKTDNEIPKPMIFDVMTEINRVVVHAPIKVGDMIIEDILGTGVNVVATRSMNKKNTPKSV